MASLAGCVASAASLELLSSTMAKSAISLSRASSCAKASSSSTISTVSPLWIASHRRRSANDGKAVSRLASSSASSICGAQVLGRDGEGKRGGSIRPRVVDVRGYQSSSDVVGEDPSWAEDDYVAVGLAHCFRKDDDSKLQNAFVIEPIPAGGLECMENGGVTCYMHATGTTLGVVLKQDVSLLPKEFASASFGEDFEFRTKCASRTWKRDHARQHLMNLVPQNGAGVRSDWNFSLQDKRILNQEHIVKDSDNIKQDMSIDVYGRTDKEEEMTAEIGQLYNV